MRNVIEWNHLKRYVFQSLLKAETDCAFLIIRGSVFQSLGSAIEKARSPYVEVVDLGTVSKPREVERKLRDGT